MRKLIEQGVVTLDGQMSTPQNWLPTRWAGEFRQHAEVWPTMEEAFGDYAVRMNTIPKQLSNGILGLTYVPTTQ